ncbi:MAG: hypothetical protein ACREQW_22245 [Candidatus Binatia bacterium]
MKRPLIVIRILLLSALVFTSKAAWADHGAGVPIAQYAPRNQNETEIVRLIRTVGQGWERKDIDQVMSAYGPDALQRAWNNPSVMIDYAGIRAEALGAFRDPKVGQIRFEDWIHRIYIVNNSALVEINQKFHGWGGDHYYRDFWMFGRRDRRWWLVRYDYEPQPPFDRR